MEKKNVVVLFGGNSSEHEVSCVSATTIIKCIDKEKYDVILIGITKAGQWLLVNSVEEIENKTWYESKASAVISPDTTKKEIIVCSEEGYSTMKADLVIPVLHGPNGEDGTVQGLLELSQIPYVGCGVLCSSVSMDKLYTKIVVNSLGFTQADYVGLFASELKDMDASVAKVEAKLEYPVFVKPSNAGSSNGVSKACDRAELVDALLLAAKHDSKILVEETIIGREIECAVLGNHANVKASGVGEILAAGDTGFYDYESKYHNAESKTVIDPKLPKEVVEQIRMEAVEIFKAVSGSGLSRVDFFVTKDENKVVFNEINTFPGFTSISMYPMLWAARGIEKTQLVEKLMELALEDKKA